jgi:hypothetical protein
MEIQKTIGEIEDCVTQALKGCRSGVSPNAAQQVSVLLSKLRRQAHAQSSAHQVSVSLVQDAYRCDEVSRRCRDAKIQECQTLLWQRGGGDGSHDFALAQSATRKLADSLQEIDPFRCGVSRDLHLLREQLDAMDTRGDDV